MCDYTREEINLMALAAGVKIEMWGADGIPWVVIPSIIDDGDAVESWTPWLDKAQAFDLMVNAKLSVDEFDHDDMQYVGVDCCDNFVGLHREHFIDHDDRPSAYMHAICRAAIEKGRAMKQETAA